MVHAEAREPRPEYEAVDCNSGQVEGGVGFVGDDRAVIPRSIDRKVVKLRVSVPFRCMAPRPILATISGPQNCQLSRGSRPGYTPGYTVSVTYRLL